VPADLHPAYVAAGTAPEAKPIWCIEADSWPARRDSLAPAARAFAEAVDFKPEPGNHLLLPGKDGTVAGALYALDKPSARQPDAFLPGKLATLLPAGTWRFETAPPDSRLAALAFALGGYRFTRYRKNEAKTARIELPAGVDGNDLTRIVEAVFFVRDLINTPANDIGPAELETSARAVASEFGASLRSVVGEALRAEGFPLVHAVGRAAAREPRLIDFVWGDPKHPKLTLVGKGVCFDTGGLDIKPSAAMLLMKKDKGGAATALGLARLVMGARLPVRLRVIVPAVENSVSGDAMRPGDVLKSRKGITVEIGNTDAEGRLILADALALADEDAPELLIDFATLTGSARVALGPDVPAAFTDDDNLAAELARHAATEADPVWRMPLWRPYQILLDSKIADLNNVSSGPHGGAITAALFLARFVERARTWLHVDLFAWNASTKPGRPEGGEAQTIRALYALLRDRYG
jgi:leucyl aminopeptidase